MIKCQEINDYIDYVKKNPDKINKERKLLIKNIVMPTLARNDVFFDEKTYQNCLKYCENNYYPLFPYQKFIYAFVFMYVDDVPLFTTIIILMGRGNGKDGFIMPLMNFFRHHYTELKIITLILSQIMNSKQKTVSMLFMKC